MLALTIMAMPLLLPSEVLPSFVEKHTTAKACTPFSNIGPGVSVPNPMTDSDGDGLPDCADMCPFDKDNKCFELLDSVIDWLKSWFDTPFVHSRNTCQISGGGCTLDFCETCISCKVGTENGGNCPGDGEPISVDGDGSDKDNKDGNTTDKSKSGGKKGG